MSIYIKGMEMPKNCWHCPMINSSDECCLLTEEQHDMYEGVMDQVQAAFCPLIEIPPHGRLIDADKLSLTKRALDAKRDYLLLAEKEMDCEYEQGFWDGLAVACDQIKKARAIIPADKEKKNES